VTAITDITTFDVRDLAFTATGNATGAANVTTTKKVTYVKPRTPAGHKAAKERYERRLADAAKWYPKALKKANTNAKKAAVKKTYAKKKAAYKKAYMTRYRGVKVVPTTNSQPVVRPFAIDSNLVIERLG
jgi:uncharacterized sporulation protein YeaH/YhbH (DUF444 family)